MVYLSQQEVLILGIETSCDETSAAIVRDGRDILSNVIHSQISIHQPFGGVVPEVASRKHIENIPWVVDQAFTDAGLTYEDIHAVAVTNRPGLIGALLVGLSYAKGFAYALKLPLIGVNHLQGHIYANILKHGDIPFPAVCLVVSGGHTSLLLMENQSQYQLLGGTLDDAAGEAFDKVARFLGLGYPGGPAIEKAARTGEAGHVRLPRVFLDRPDYNFSFSGLKTADMNMWIKLQRQGDKRVDNMAAEFQLALVEVLVEKTLRAARAYEVSSILLAGGVAANSLLRSLMENRAEDEGKKVYYPPIELCTDNAAMIAGRAYEDFCQGIYAGLDLNAQAHLPSI